MNKLRCGVNINETVTKWQKTQKQTTLCQKLDQEYLLYFQCGFFRRKRPEDAISASQKPLVYKNGSQANYGNQQMYGNPSGYGNDLMSRPYE